MGFKINDKIKLIVDNHSLEGIIKHIYYTTKKDSQWLYAVKVTKSDIPDVGIGELVPCDGFGMKLWST